MSGWEGHAKRECGQHRSTGGRAWCFDCSEWCYPATPCARCEIPLLIAERDRYREALEGLVSPSGAKHHFVLGGECGYCEMGPTCPYNAARAALDSDPDLAERTRRIRADE